MIRWLRALFAPRAPRVRIDDWAQQERIARQTCEPAQRGAGA